MISFLRRRLNQEGVGVGGTELFDTWGSGCDFIETLPSKANAHDARQLHSSENRRIESRPLAVCGQTTRAPPRRSNASIARSWQLLSKGARADTNNKDASGENMWQCDQARACLPAVGASKRLFQSVESDAMREAFRAVMTNGSHGNFGGALGGPFDFDQAEIQFGQRARDTKLVSGLGLSLVAVRQSAGCESQRWICLGFDSRDFCKVNIAAKQDHSVGLGCQDQNQMLTPILWISMTGPSYRQSPSLAFSSTWQSTAE